MDEEKQKPPVTLSDEEIPLVLRLIREKYPHLHEHNYVPQSPDEWTAKRLSRKIVRTVTIDEDDEIRQLGADL